MAMLTLRFAPTDEFAEPHELRMRTRHVVGFVERLHGDLPVAVEHDPAAPPAAHVLQLERLQERCGRLEIIPQGLTLRVEIDPDPPAPRVDLDAAEPSALIGERTPPVLLVHDESALAFEVVRPAMKTANELQLLALGVMGARRRIDQAAPAVRAHVVERLDGVGRRTHDQNRVIEDLIGDVITDLGDLLETPSLQPDLAPQLVALGSRVFL